MYVCFSCGRSWVRILAVTFTLKDLLETIATVGYCIPIKDFFL